MSEETDETGVAGLGMALAEVVLRAPSPESSRTGDLHPVVVDVDGDLLPPYLGAVVAVHDGVRDRLPQDLLRDLRNVPAADSVHDAAGGQVAQDGEHRVLDGLGRGAVAILAVEEPGGGILRLRGAGVHGDVDRQLGELLLGVDAHGQVAGESGLAVGRQCVDPSESARPVLGPDAVERPGAAPADTADGAGDEVLGQVGQTGPGDGGAVETVFGVAHLKEIDLVGGQALVVVVDPLEAAVADAFRLDVAGPRPARVVAQWVDLDAEHLGVVDPEPVHPMGRHGLHLRLRAGCLVEARDDLLDDPVRVEALGGGEAPALVEPEDDEAALGVGEGRDRVPHALRQALPRRLGLDECVVASLTADPLDVRLEFLFSHDVTVLQ